jgi:deoxyribose-phosphate aldolase
MPASGDGAQPAIPVSQRDAVLSGPRSEERGTSAGATREDSASQASRRRAGQLSTSAGATREGAAREGGTGRWAGPGGEGEDRASDAALRRALHGLPGVDQVGAQERAAALATRSIKREAKLWALEMAVRMVDLTTLEGADTPGKIRGLCAKARQPDPGDPGVPPVAAVCVYPDLVTLARAEVAGSPVAVASVATAFPSGRASLAVKLADVAEAVDAGADEVDMVIDRAAFLAGRYAQVYEEVRAVREACGAAHLKVILETGELATLDNVSRASWLVMLAGADFIKTSTGKVQPASTPPVALVMLSAARDFAAATGRRVGVKVAGGIRTAKDAIRYLVLVREIAGPEWLSPDYFRIGASSLLNDLLMQRSKQLTGAYAGPDYFTLD